MTLNHNWVHKPLLMIILTVISNTSLSQEDKISDAITSIAEELAVEESDSEETALYTERLHELLDNPVKINSADEPELSRLFFLSGFQVKALTDYVTTTGKIISQYEIANIPGFDRETVEMMAPFICLNTETVPTDVNSKWRSTLLTNLSVKPSQDDSNTLGSPWKILTKYKFAAGTFSGGFLTEKDSGEKYFSGSPPKADFFSAHLVFAGSGILRKIIAGDFSASFGLGTNINTGIRSGVSLTTPGFITGRDEIKPYTSTDENNFFRGTAVMFRLKQAGLSLFWSSNTIDAATGTTNGPTNDHIESFYLSGNHSTPASLMKKDVITETCYGANLSGTFSNVRIGLLFSENRFSLPVRNFNPLPRELYDFEGDRNRIATAYYNALVNRMLFFGEISYNFTGKTAFIQGLSFRPADRLNINLLYRNYEPGFTSFHGKGPFSSSSGENISGLSGNFTFEAAKYLFISAGCDLRYNPWLKYRCSAPSSSVSKEVRIKYLPSEKFVFEGLYSYRLTTLNSQNSGGIVKQEELVSRSARVTVRFSPAGNLTFGNRIEYKSVRPSGSRGMLIYQDISIRSGSLPLSLWARYCIFNTSDWDSRLYSYENDLLYSFSIPALSGEGTRSYIMLKWKIGENAEMRFKYGISSLTGTDNETRCSDEIKIQFRMML